MDDFEIWLKEEIIKQELISSKELETAVNKDSLKKQSLDTILLREGYISQEQINKLEKKFQKLTIAKKLESIDSPMQKQMDIPDGTVPISRNKKQMDIPDGTVPISRNKNQIDIPNGTVSISRNKKQMDIPASTVPISRNKKQIAKVAKQKLEISGTFGKYQIISQLGEGNRAKVFLAFDPTSNQEIALKIFTISIEDDQIAHFKRENQAIARLYQPNIAKVHHIGRENGTCYCAMDYIPGLSIAKILSCYKRISSRRAAMFIAKLAKSLYNVHNKKIFHQNIKPSNIIIDEEDEPFLVDFGLAGDIERDFSYMAPEQIHNKIDYINASSDIYSLTSCFYEMLTGKQPFNKKENKGFIAPSKIYTHIPEELENICRKALAKKQSLRYSSALMMTENLEDYLLGKKHKTKKLSMDVFRFLCIALFFIFAIIVAIMAQGQ